jgi:serine phosphatase RsbU (regulator of sigma subunit)
LLLVYKYFSELSVARGDFKNAYYFADTTTMYRDSIINETNIASLNELNERFDSEKKQLQIENLSKENNYKEQQNRQQRIFLTAVGAALFVSIILGISVYRQFREKKKSNLLIGKQKELLEEKQKEILDSLSYAKYLQEAILPPQELVKQHLPESFILYKPKDIVAGDFYWMHTTESGSLLIAAADCTGHGVPGAMVSVVCSNALNRVVTEFNITEPGKILDKTRELVLATFARSNKNVNDGMDISLCCIDIKTKKVLWGGANNPLWYLQNGEVKEITADKQPVGKTEITKPFTTHEIQLSAGDTLFLFTDGYADQFGGEKGKKFKYKPFKELLISTSTLSPEKQKEQLDKTFTAWKGNLEQVDDICLIGIRL